jgi:Zn-dependent protease with chaperone function
MVKSNLLSGNEFWVTRKLLAVKQRTAIAALLLAGLTFSACVAIEPPPSRRAPREDYGSPSPSSRRVDPHDAERLRRVMVPLLRSMDRPCRLEEVRVGVLNQSEINAGNAGSCQFLVTMGLLQRANDEQLRGVLAHEVAHQDLGHVAKAQALGAGANILAAGLQQLFPAAGVLAPIVGELGMKNMRPTAMRLISYARLDIRKKTWSRRLPGFVAFPVTAAAVGFSPPTPPSMIA